LSFVGRQRAFGMLLACVIRLIPDSIGVITLHVVTKAIEEPEAARCGSIGGLARSA